MVYFTLQMPQFLLQLFFLVCIRILQLLDATLKKIPCVCPLAIVEQIQQVDFVFLQSSISTLQWLCLAVLTGVWSLLH